MCNWVINKITLKGQNTERISNHFIKDESRDEPYFDFNTVIKMPKELNIEKSSRTHDGFLLYLASINPLITSFGNKEDKLTPKEFADMLLQDYPQALNNLPRYVIKQSHIDELVAKYGIELDDVIAAGKQAYDNHKKYGCSDWYEWRVKHWGTKWNSSNSSHTDDYSTIYFDTAWSPSLEVIARLSKMYPDLEITHEWAEEQTAWYCGKYTYRGGELVEELDYEEFSKEAYELYFELWGGEEDYRFNEETGTYESIEGEE